MSRQLLPVMALMLVASAALAQSVDTPATYHNARFGYSISYPADLFQAEPESQNSDGRRFHAPNGGAHFAVWASYNSLQQTPTDIAADAASGCLPKSAPYRVMKVTLVAVSCETKDGIYYRKTLIRGDVLTSFDMTYPASERTTWDPVVAKMSASLTAAK
jgi:hypothetical protein